MSTLDLSGLKSQLETSSKSLSSLSSTLNIQATGNVTALVPEVGQLQDLLPRSIASLDSTTASIGSNIVGVSATSNKSMEGLVKGLTPNLKGVKDLATTAAAKLSSALPVRNLALEQTCTSIATQADTAQAATTLAVATITSTNQQGPSEFPQMLGEIQTLYDALSAYDSGVSAHIFDSTNALPSLDSVLGGLTVDQLTARSQADKDAAVDLCSGTMSRIVYKSAGILREVSARRMTKAELYDQGIADSASYSKEHTGEAGRSVSELRGSTPYQGEGL